MTLVRLSVLISWAFASFFAPQCVCVCEFVHNSRLSNIVAIHGLCCALLSLKIESKLT